MKQSPAPVVSTTFRHHTGMWIRTSNAQTNGCGRLCIRDRCRLHVCGDEITVSTEKIGCFSGPPVLTCNEPLVPRLTRTVSAPCSSITCAAASASSSDSVFLPASHLASSESSPQGLLQQACTGPRAKQVQCMRKLSAVKCAPVSRASSVSFGDRMLMFLSRSGEIGPSTPPQSSNTGTPAAAAMLATCTLTSSGISLWSSTAPALRRSCKPIKLNN